MLTNFYLAVLSSVIISSIPLSVVFFYEFIRKNLNKIISFAAGIFIGAFLGVMLEKIVILGLKHNTNIEMLFYIILASFLSFFVIEYFFHFHHHGEKGHYHAVGIINLIGDFFHNFIDGLGIAAAFKVSVEFGVITTLIIAAHEFPQEFGDFSILLHSGFDKIKALILNFLVGLTAVLGTVIGFFIEVKAEYLLAIVAGSFLYLGAVDLIPLIKENKKDKIKNFLFFLTGVIFIIAFHKIFH